MLTLIRAPQAGIRIAAIRRMLLCGALLLLAIGGAAADAITLTAVQSRKFHGAGTFDISVDITQTIGGAITVESRAIGAGHQIVFQFDSAVTTVGIPTAIDEAGDPVGNLSSPVVAGNDVAVIITGVPDNKRVTIRLPNVNGSDFAASLGFLVGDVNNSRFVSPPDIQQVRARSGQVVDAGNFRHDINATGAISAADISAVKGRSGRNLPAAISIAAPPDPSTVAPPTDPTVATDIASATAFLYTGANPIQTGVASGTIVARRAAVLRGKVSARDGSPIATVKISILGHPEFGQTLTRIDGAFDLAVNGGGPLTVVYQKTNLLPVQRAIVAPWRDYAWLPDVVMIPFDSAVTAINLSGASAMQTARGNPVTDNDGTRQATILFPSGTTATMVLANGTTQPLTTLGVRATEYTVGASGPKAMPAPLPLSTGYTYAAEFSVDEAIAAGATEVRFSQALPVYLENFIGFKAGTIVPSGIYDRQKGQWIASADGRIIKILGITGGVADLDTDGDDIIDDATKLAALGITVEERTRLALLYTTGQSLWRVPVSHFSPCDFNFRWGPPPDAVPPPGPSPSPPPIDPCKSAGSVIGCEDQSLGESLPVTGTPWRIHYQSERTPGRKDAYTLEIPVSGASIPPSLASMSVQVSIAGRLYSAAFAPAPNVTYTVIWDGLDSYGRRLQGPQFATIAVDYHYVTQYYRSVPFLGLSSFGSGLIGYFEKVYPARSPFTLSSTWTQKVGAWIAPALGMGGWSPGVQHAYVPDARMLLLGDGRQRRADALTSIITTVAGGGFGVDGGLATAASLTASFQIAAGRDGSLYIVDAGSNRVRRVGPDGIIANFAGGNGNVNNAGAGFAGDGGPATAAALDTPNSIAVGPDGSLYISDFGNARIRRVAPDGIISTVAGNGPGTSSGDGGLATAAKFSPFAVGVGPDGSVFIADSGTSAVRRVGTDGIISTVAGNGTNGYSGDGGQATAAMLGVVTGLAVGPDGSLFIADTFNNRIRRVAPDGIITTVAGDGSGGAGGDGGPAALAALNQPRGVAVGPDGSVFIGDAGNNLVRRVGADGIITTVAGNGVGATQGDGGPAVAAALNSPRGVAVGPDGGVFIGAANFRVRHIGPALPDFAVFDMLLASEDGREIYVFNIRGRHLRTLDALTGAPRYQFGYDASGYLVSITDVSGNVTAIERSGAAPTAIVAPGGQRTTLVTNPDGWLISATNPAAESSTMSYSSDGLMQNFTDPRGNVHLLTYDAVGRLVKDQDPVGGFTSLARTKQFNGYTVTAASALGRTRVYQVEQLSTGVVRRTVTGPSGVKTVTMVGSDASEQTTYADGGVATVRYGPDPRWGMQVPFAASEILTTPGGRTRTIIATRSATLSDPLNPLSMTNLTDTVTENGAASTRVYDASSRVFTTTSAAGRSSTTSIDTLGRTTQEQIAALAPTSFGYNGLGLLGTVTEGSGVGSRVTTLSYNATRDLGSMADPLGRTTGFAYDPAGRIITQTLPDARTVQFAYDAAGNATAITPPGRPAHAFTYSPIDQLSAYTPPDLGIGSTATQYTYNTDGAPTRVTGPDGQLIDFAYDAAGRTSTITFARGLLSYTYSPTSAFLSGIAAPGGIGLDFTYDANLLTREAWSGPVSGDVASAYNNNFRIATETVNAANSVSFGYATDGVLTSAGGLTLTRNAQNGLPTGSVMGNVTESATYDSFAAVTNYSASYSGSGIYSTTYTRDAIGRITQKIETIGGVTTTYGYAYDLAGRLAGVTTSGGPATTYIYDSNGNRTGATGPGGAVSGVYDDQDRLLVYGNTSYTYNANGDALGKTTGVQSTTYQYDAFGSLAAATLPGPQSIEYLIDGSNRRIGKKVNGTLVQGFLYQGQLRPVAELDGANAVVSRFVYASRSNVPDFMIKGGATYRIISDHLGSPRLVINIATGIVAQRMDYDEFGQVLGDTQPGFQPFGFAGGLYDRDTGLVRFGARDYDPATGRWTTKDAIAFAGEDTNLYGYVINDPVNFIDRDGLSGVRVNGTLWIKSKDTKVLKEAKTDSDVVEILQPGDEVKWLGKDPASGLDRVEVHGCKGFVHRSNLTPRAPTSNVDHGDGQPLRRHAIPSSGAATRS